jgi:Ser/Thr protein kinase RdoA (MazF antagonist)
LIAEIRARLTDELDLAKEATHQRAYAAAFAGDAQVGVPEVHPAWCTRDVLTTTLVTGAGLEEAALGPEASRAAWAVAAWRLFVDGALRTSLLHGDPHPGNLLFRPDGGLWGLDYGCVQPLAPPDRAAVASLLASAGRGPSAVRAAVAAIVGAEGVFTDALADVWTDLLAPATVAHFRVDKAHAQKVAASIRRSKDPRITFRGGGAQVPPWFVLAHRTFVGLVSVLARLDVAADYVTPTRAALAEA